ncbi:MAG TPA: hypothetical protein VMB21_15480 [Candidatus Limnocylindria bacterium]|jgi:hypothetical protein|nr:hypothetical protein [Candidatus Limnocylindria bacterium]
MPSPSEPALSLVATVSSETPAARRWSAWRAWRGLLWSEWFAHARMLLFFLVAWIAAVWLLPLVVHPLWILMLGAAYALVAGPAFGGADVAAGCEEFSFALPAPRGRRFIARLVVGGGGLLLLTAANVFALNTNLADILVRVFLDSGLTGFELRQPELLYGLVFAFPFAVFAVGFSVASLATGRTVAFTAWVWGTLGALATLRGAAMAEEAIWDRLNGRLIVSSLLLIATVTLLIAGRAYVRKEAGPGGSPLRMPLSWWGGLALLLLAAAAVALLLVWLTTNFGRLL